MQCPQYTTSSRYKLRFSEFHKTSPAVQQPTSQEPKTVIPAITKPKRTTPPVAPAATQKVRDTFKNYPNFLTEAY